MIAQKAGQIWLIKEARSPRSGLQVSGAWVIPTATQVFAVPVLPWSHPNLPLKCPTERGHRFVTRFGRNSTQLVIAWPQTPRRSINPETTKISKRWLADQFAESIRKRRARRGQSSSKHLDRPGLIRFRVEQRQCSANL